MQQVLLFNRSIDSKLCFVRLQPRRQKAIPGIDDMLLPVDLVVIHDQREGCNITHSVDIRVACLQLAVHLQPQRSMETAQVLAEASCKQMDVSALLDPMHLLLHWLLLRYTARTLLEKIL